MTIKKNYRNVIRAGLTACFYFCVALSFGQTIQTITDKKDILIGEQVNLKIIAVFPSDFKGSYKGISIPDSITHFDIVETGKPDTLNYKDNSRAVEQTIIFTSFDSGKWVFPSLAVEFSTTTDQPVQKLQTDSFYINVSYAAPDSTNQLRDIKPIIPISISDYTWYYIAGGIVLLLLVIVLLFLYFKKKRKLQTGETDSKISAYEEAVQELIKLSQYNLQNADEVKIYHIKLSGIFKRYLGRKQYKNLLNRTTGDLLISMAEMNLTSNDISNLAISLRCTDAVKFAKYIPAVAESEDSLIKIKAAINSIEQQTKNNKP